MIAADVWERPLVIVGGLAPEDRPAVLQFLRNYNVPVYAEPTSGLREAPELEPLLVFSGERMLARGDFDGVLRIGNVPALRFWRELDDDRRHIDVISLSNQPFAGISRGQHFQGVIPLLLPRVRSRIRSDEFFRHDRQLARSIDEIVESEPTSELGIFRVLSELLPMKSRVYLGNSLPIREWDLVATRNARELSIEANRGANGIDGQLSTFFGWCAPEAMNVAIVGDLTAMYDLSAPWIVPQLDQKTRFLIVIINNGGGRIFSRVPSMRALSDDAREKYIENTHSIQMRAWASMWGLSYDATHEISRLPPHRRSVLEVFPDADATRRVWERYDALWSAAPASS